MYKIVFTASAEKELQQLPEVEIIRILHKIETLSENPKSLHAVKIIGKQGLWRIRSGNYRIVYSIQNRQLIIEIIRIRHRKEAYRRL